MDESYMCTAKWKNPIYTLYDYMKNTKQTWKKVTR